MTVGELIHELEYFAKRSPALYDTPVLLSSDEEQNYLGDVLHLQIGNLNEYDNYHGTSLGKTKREQKNKTFVVIVPTL